MSITLRTMTRDDWPAVAELIHVSTNYWYETHHRFRIFVRPPRTTQLFCEVYEALDPGCCVLAVSDATGHLAGSCFFHPRPTHVSLGIMNVHPNYFGHRVGRQLLDYIIAFARSQQKPVRLVSSAMNLDSFSLYNKAGFVPRTAFQDMFMEVPATGLDVSCEGKENVRRATMDDVDAMRALEMELVGIDRKKDFHYFIKNELGIWHTVVYKNDRGDIEGFLVSVKHEASNMLGPGVARSESQTAALIHAQLDHHAGGKPVWLVPCACGELVQTLYSWGAKNCELHLASCLGEWTDPTGVVMPTFMPETG